LAARSDPPHYGKLIALDFPKAKLIYGPKQIEARIDQDAFISQQLSLWGQRGSQVIRGSLLAIRDVATLRAAPLPRCRKRVSARAKARDCRFRQSDRHGGNPRAIATKDFWRQTISPTNAAAGGCNGGVHYRERAGPPSAGALFTRPRITAPRRLGRLRR